MHTRTIIPRPAMFRFPEIFVFSLLSAVFVSAATRNQARGPSPSVSREEAINGVVYTTATSRPARTRQSRQKSRSLDLPADLSSYPATALAALVGRLYEDDRALSDAPSVSRSGVSKSAPRSPARKTELQPAALSTDDALLTELREIHSPRALFPLKFLRQCRSPSYRKGGGGTFCTAQVFSTGGGGKTKIMGQVICWQIASLEEGKREEGK